MLPPEPGSLVPLQLDGDEAWITRDRAWVWVPRATLDRLRLAEPTRPRMVRIHPSELADAQEPATGTPMTEVDGTAAEADRTRDRRLQQAAVWIAASALLVAFASGTWLGLLLRPTASFPYVEAEPEPFAALATPEDVPPTPTPKAERAAKPKPSEPTEKVATEAVERSPGAEAAPTESRASPPLKETTNAPADAAPGNAVSTSPPGSTTDLLKLAEHDPAAAASEANRRRAAAPDDIDLRYAAAYAEFKAGRREEARDLYCASRSRFRAEDQREFDSFLRQYKLSCP